MTTCHFIPPYLLDRLQRSATPDLADLGRRTRAIDDTLRARRNAGPTTTAPEPATTRKAWEVYDARNGNALPGTLVRSAGDDPVADVTVNEAATGVTEQLKLFAEYGRSSYDDKGATAVCTVHYEKGYDNAFWDGNQLVFGDGDGKVFGRFTKPIDVLGHELSHAVTQYTANFTYNGQPGALNESMSDVFASCMKQRVQGESAQNADWLIGEGIFVGGVKGRALRSMESPGTAYDDPRLGKDPQVGDMKDYVETTDDNGGVHINSGIPNRAFCLAAKAVGGESWSGAGRMWYAALTSGLTADTDFATFAAATVAAAGQRADVVQQAWASVGVTPATTTGPAGAPAPQSGIVRVTRTGGFAGIVREGNLDLTAADDRAVQARRLVERIDFRAVGASSPQPDRFVYTFHEPSGEEAVVGEHELTDDQRRLAALVLGEDPL